MLSNFVFCNDIIAICERAGSDQAITSAIIRWKYWKEMFGKKKQTILDKQEIKGQKNILCCPISSAKHLNSQHQ